MIHRTVEVSVTPSPRELEGELWKMDSIAQADFVLAMTQRMSDRALSVRNRVEKFAEGFENLNHDERRDAIMLFNHILEVMKNKDRELNELEERKMDFLIPSVGDEIRIKFDDETYGLRYVVGVAISADKQRITITEVDENGIKSDINPWDYPEVVRTGAHFSKLSDWYKARRNLEKSAQSMIKEWNVGG